ncbi:uncharacterized protein LOC131329002 isoform X3 [Rhododendron vialii]|nr:uncharacterized protein LOC131329002 isoform X3 [Rhododendron vialii]
MPSPNGSEHVLSSCGEENYAKEHLERGHCIDEANVHDDNSLDRRNGRMRFSEFHGFLRLLPLPVFSFPQRCSLRSRDRVFVLPRKSNKACYGSGSRREVAALTIKCQAPLKVQRGIKKATTVNETKPLTGEKKATNQTPLEVQGDEKMVGPTEPTVVVMKFPRRSPLP